MNYHGITINNLHSYNDFDLIMTDRNITTPSKIKIKKSVPYLNGYYDFSDINGTENYDERSLEYTFKFKCNSLKQFENKYINILRWIVHGTKKELRDDLLEGYYFLAECEGKIEYKRFDTNRKYGYITISFVAYPFKIGDRYEGNNLWDPFNFETDVLQDTKFDVNGSKEVNIYNLSAISVVPKVVCSSEMSVTKENVTYNFKAGESEDYRFIFKPYENKLTIKGNGTIEFLFRKMVI